MDEIDNMDEMALSNDDIADDEEIIMGNNVMSGAVGDAEVLPEVRSERDEEIIVGDIDDHEDWHRIVKHLNHRIGELEQRVALLEAALKAAKGE